MKPVLDAAVHCLGALSTTFFMSPGARNWPSDDVHWLAAGATAWMKSVCRQPAGGTSTTAATAGMSSRHVGEDRHADLATKLVEQFRPASTPGPRTDLRNCGWPCRRKP